MLLRFMLLLTLLTLAACGQKGSLYLPDDAAPKPPVTSPASTPASNSSN